MRRPASNFAVTGVAGYIAPRHLAAICETGNRIVAAVDPHDAVGVLDRFSFDVRFFTDLDRFEGHLHTLGRGPERDRVHYVSICSPNDVHDAHVRLALRAGADAICEKPLVLDPRALDGLQTLEAETGGRVYTVAQVRVHPAVGCASDATPGRRPHVPRGAAQVRDGTRRVVSGRVEGIGCGLGRVG